MFYCNECAKPRNWPETMFKSKGKCEVCGTLAVCNERQSSKLPIPPRDLFEDLIDDPNN